MAYSLWEIIALCSTPRLLPTCQRWLLSYMTATMSLLYAMENFQDNWPLFWGYIFYFPLPPVAHLTSLPRTKGNLCRHLLPWQQGAIPWLFYYLLGVNSALHQALVSLSVCRVSAISSPLCHRDGEQAWNLCFVFVTLSASVFQLYGDINDKFHKELHLAMWNIPRPNLKMMSLDKEFIQRKERRQVLTSRRSGLCLVIVRRVHFVLKQFQLIHYFVPI